jgi:hypothetical protein
VGSHGPGRDRGRDKTAPQAIALGLIHGWGVTEAFGGFCILVGYPFVGSVHRLDTPFAFVDVLMYCMYKFTCNLLPGSYDLGL